MIDAAQSSGRQARLRTARNAMTAELVAAGVLRDPDLRRLFQTVPRDVFVPAFYSQTVTDGTLRNRLISRDDPATASQWEQGVYANRPLLTHPDLSSSATSPRLMAAMLEALGEPGGPGPVLEIGTGTGYNTALLCGAFDDQVVSIDVDADLIDTARHRLHSIDHHPRLVLGDGADGYPADAPYARLIATCGVRQLPETWVEQVQVGGRIVTPIGAGIAVLTVTGPAAAEGRFLPISAYFMQLRPLTGSGPSAPALTQARSAAGEVRAAQLPGETVLDDAFRFPLSLTLTDLTHAMTDDPNPAHLFALPDNSWARVCSGTVTQGGTRRIWDEIEDLHHEWVRGGRPTRDQYTIMIEHGQQHIGRATAPQPEGLQSGGG